MRTHWILCGAMLLTACHRRGGGYVGARGGGTAAAPRTDNDRVLYTLGTILADDLRRSNLRLTRTELAMVQRGMTDRMVDAHLAVDTAQYRTQVRAFAQARAMESQQTARREGTAFLDRAAAEAGAQRLPSGVLFRELSPGNGAQPAPSDTVSVNYRGTLPDGSEFDSSQRTGHPASFQLSGVIPCWTQGVGRMHVGGRARLVCPPDTAYGGRGMPGIPAGSTLNFEVELLSITPAGGGASAPGAPATSGTSGSGASGASSAPAPGGGASGASAPAPQGAAH